METVEGKVKLYNRLLADLKDEGVAEYAAPYLKALRESFLAE